MAIVQAISPPRFKDEKEVRKWYELVANRLSYQTYAGDPTENLLPRWIGDQCHDTTNNDWYKSISKAAAGWKKITA